MCQLNCLSISYITKAIMLHHYTMYGNNEVRYSSVLPFLTSWSVAWSLAPGASGGFDEAPDEDECELCLDSIMGDPGFEGDPAGEIFSLAYGSWYTGCWSAGRSMAFLLATPTVLGLIILGLRGGLRLSSGEVGWEPLVKLLSAELMEPKWLLALCSLCKGEPLVVVMDRGNSTRLVDLDPEGPASPVPRTLERGILFFFFVQAINQSFTSLIKNASGPENKVENKKIKTFFLHIFHFSKTANFKKVQVIIPAEKIERFLTVSNAFPAFFRDGRGVVPAQQEVQQVKGGARELTEKRPRRRANQLVCPYRVHTRKIITGLVQGYYSLHMILNIKWTCLQIEVIN